MALSIGELVGYVSIDDSGVASGVNSAEAAIRRLPGAADAALGGMDDTFRNRGRGAGNALGDGLTEGAGAGADRASGEVERRTSGMGAKVKAIAVGAGALAGAGLGYAMAQSLDVSEAQAKLTAQLGGSSEYAGEMGAIAGRLYANAYGENLGEVNDAVREVINSGALMEDATGADIESLTGKAMSLASAFGVDVSDVVKQVGQLMRNGMAPDATAALDVITRGFQQGVDKAGDLLPTIEEYGPQFKQMGLSAEDAMGLMSQGLKAGARDADITADAVKEFALIAVDATGTAGKGYATLGLDAQKMAGMVAAGGPSAKQALQMTLDGLRGIKDPTLQAATAVQLFGTKAEDMQDALFALDPSKAALALGDVSGAAAKLDETLGATAQAKVTGMQRSFDMWTASLVGTTGPVGDVGAAVMAFGPQALGMAGSLALVGMAAGPMIAQLAAGGASLAVQAAGYVASFASMAAGAAMNAARMVATLVVWAATQVAQGAIALASMIATGVAYVAQWVVMAAGAMARAAIMAASWLVAMGPVGWVIALIVGLVALIVANWDTVVAWTTQAWSAVTAFVSQQVEQARAVVAAVIGAVVAFVTSAWSQAQAATSAAWSAVTGAISAAVEFVRSTVTSVINTVINFLSNAWSTATSVARAAWDLMINTIRGAITNGLAIVRALPGQILSSLGNLGSLLVNAGRNVVEGLWNGIVGMGSWLYNQIMGWIRNVVPGPILQFLGIASPSRFMRDEVGRWIPEGLAGGIIGNARVAADAARELAAGTAAGAVDGARGAMSGVTVSLGADLGDPGDYGPRPPRRPGDGSGGPMISVTVHNPLPETTSSSINRRARTLATLGAF